MTRIRRSSSLTRIGVVFILALGSAAPNCEGCGGAHPRIKIEPSVVTFLDPLPGDEYVQWVNVTNSDEQGEVDPLTFKVRRFDPFLSLDARGNWAPETLSSGETFPLRIRYASTDSGAREGTVVIDTNDPRNLVVEIPVRVRFVNPLAVVGVCQEPQVENCPRELPATAVFAGVPIGTCADATVWLRNHGELPLLVEPPSFAPESSPEITFDEWTPVALSLEQSVGRWSTRIPVKYCPTPTSPTESQAKLVLRTNSPSQPVIEVPIVGRSAGSMCPLVVDGCDASETCDNGLDDDCDGQVDEGCPCAPGEVRGCFAGPPGRRGVGACTDGTMRCNSDGGPGRWGPCTGGIAPTAEVCDQLDNDCEGCVDQDLECGPVTLACPDSASLPEGVPFQDYVIDASSWITGTTASWSWTVQGGPCDQLFATTTNPVTQSFALTGQSTSTLRFRPTLSGDYTVTSSIVDGAGATHACTFVVHVGGPGLRVEMCSDRTGATDLDLHLHRPNTPAVGWFQDAGNSACSYLNCKATSFSPASWGYASSPLANCVGGPEGTSWQSVGHCRNPRLDIDNINVPGVAENINVDVPENASYRVMVNYFSGTGVVRPLVNIYCGGRLEATYGQAPDLVPGFDQPGQNDTGDMWRVVDVTPTVVDGVTTGCTLAPLHPPGETSGYWVATTPRTY